MSESWVTLCTNDSYAIGAINLIFSLKEHRTQKATHCLYTKQVSDRMRRKLERSFDSLTLVDVFDSKDAENLALINRSDLGVTFTKLHSWRLTQYSKCVFVDADMLALANCDELFERDEFSAVADIGWPDYFNSGLFVFKPSIDTYRALVQMATTQGSFDGADQGLLNAYFHNWRDLPSSHRLPFIYNMTGGTHYTYAAAYRTQRDQIKMVHFIGSTKPWMAGRNEHNVEHLGRWRDIYNRYTEPLLQEVDPVVPAPTPGPAPVVGQPDGEAPISDDTMCFNVIQQAIEKTLGKK